MPTALAFGFPWGRYHATPWGRHVNEAQVEFPPSPWRILRALYATWRSRADNIPDEIGFRVLDALADPPTFVLPDFIEAHTRHYMPDATHMKGRAKWLATPDYSDGARDKVFDAFVVMQQDAEVVAIWAPDLRNEEREALDRMAALVPYLGRAESICTARLLEEEEIPVGATLAPLESDDSVRDTIRLLVPRRPLDFDALTVRTTRVRGDRLLDPPGARRHAYPRPVPAQPRPVAQPATWTGPTAVRWAITGPTLPSLHAAVGMADALRRACMSQFGRLSDGAASATLAGKNAAGVPLTGHRHAHYLALDQDGDRLLDHLVLWATQGLSEHEVAALARVQMLRGFGHAPDLRPVRMGMEALGSIQTTAPELCGPARVWRSHTPFAPPRHGSRRDTWETHIQAQAREEVHRRRLPDPSRISILTSDWLAFRRHRLNEHLGDARRAAGLELEFDHPVAGPVALGALSHFGLGVFLPIE